MITEFKLFENLNIDKYSIDLDKSGFDNIYNKYCSSHKINKVKFFRGDSKLVSNYLLVNSNKTKNQLKFDFNYIITEFISSHLWSDKGYPLKKNSINITLGDKGVAGYYGGGTIYQVIPFNNAKIVILPKQFGNSTTMLLHNEGFDQPYQIAEAFKSILGGGFITLENVNDKIKKLCYMFDNGEIENLDKHRYSNMIINVIQNMKKYNMSFIDYIEYLFAPENYEIINFDENLKIDFDKYTVGWTDSKILMKKMITE